MRKESALLAMALAALAAASGCFTTPRQDAVPKEATGGTGGGPAQPGQGGGSGSGGAGATGGAGASREGGSSGGAPTSDASPDLPPATFCDPKAPPTCKDEVLQICKADGSGFAPTVCPIGCNFEGTKCNPCPTWEHACPKKCAAPDDPDRCGTSCTTCPVVANAPRICVDGQCLNACPAGAMRCQGGTGCYSRAWDFESETIGWLPHRKPLRERPLLPASLSPLAQQSAGTEEAVLASVRAHDGRLSYTLPIHVSTPATRIVARHEFCGSADANLALGTVNLAATGVSAWLFLEVDKGTFGSCHCTMGGIGVMPNGTDAYFSFQGELDLRPGQWGHMLASNADPQNTYTQSLWVNCDLVGDFTGTFYMDDVRLAPAQ